MGYKVDNAVIMAAGTSSRFAPLSYEMPKALITVKGEILIERQIRQLREAGIHEIIVVAGYKKEQLEYLRDRFGVILVENPDYMIRNNNASIYAVRDYLRNTYICSSDNYFTENPFEAEVEEAYYAAVYAEGQTSEWCMEEDADGYISKVTVGGMDSWYMLGHAFWSETFSSKFLSVLTSVYDLSETVDMLWERIFMEHLDKLKMKIRKYPDNTIFEFDTLDELREFDDSYLEDTRSGILKIVSFMLECGEKDIINVQAYKNFDNAAAGFRFEVADTLYEYDYATEKVRQM
nr:NTP transferase domain-containing protein [uncultured Acetatifactor sp.]